MKQITHNEDGTITVDGAVFTPVITEEPKKEWKSWKPESQVHYWYFDMTGCLRDELNVMDGIDIQNVKTGNCFKTKEEAENSTYIEDLMWIKLYNEAVNLFKLHYSIEQTPPLLHLLHPFVDNNWLVKEFGEENCKKLLRSIPMK